MKILLRLNEALQVVTVIRQSQDYDCSTNHCEMSRFAQHVDRGLLLRLLRDLISTP